MEFLNRNAAAIQALGAILTVALALAALIGVKLQIDAAETLQRSQSARDIYREFLSLSVNKPEFAQPDFCAIQNSPQEAAYESYVEYLLYTAEQVTDVEPGWSPVFEQLFKDHTNFICSIADPSGYAGEVAALITNFKTQNCPVSSACQ
jgi:hypothetical protein